MLEIIHILNSIAICDFEIQNKLFRNVKNMTKNSIRNKIHENEISRIFYGCESTLKTKNILL